MKFNVSSEKLFQQLQAVSRVVANKSTLKILECILFDLSGNILTLTASDGETTIRTAIDVDNAEGEGKVAFGAKLLIDTMKEFPAQPLTFTIDDYTFGMIINWQVFFRRSQRQRVPRNAQRRRGMPSYHYAIKSAP